MKKCMFFLTFTAFLLGLSVDRIASQDPVADFSGRWSTGATAERDGVLTLTQTGASLSGTLVGRPDQFWGKQKGGTLSGTVVGRTARVMATMGDGNAGPWTITLSQDGRTLSGTYVVTAGSQKGAGGTISLTRLPPAPPGKCPPTIAGKWEGPVSGLFSYEVNGNRVTGSVPNLGGKHGPATITGTLSGTGMTGTWKSADASGTIAHTGPNEACITQMTYTLDNPPRPGGSESTTHSPGGSGSSTGPGGAGGNPWESAEGRDCFEKWIALATNLLNKYDGGPGHNGRKPWSFNKYGLLEGGTPAGPKSAFAPDDFPQYGNDKYRYMWHTYETEPLGKFVRAPAVLNAAGVPPLRDYVRGCAPASTTQAIPAAGMVLVAPDLRVAKGTRVSVQVRLLRAKDVRNMKWELTYLPEVVTALPDVDRGNLITSLFRTNLNRPGLLSLDFAQDQNAPINGDGTAAGFRFDATGPARSRTPLSLSVDRVDDTNRNRLPITTINGSITIFDSNDLTDPNNPRWTGGGGGGPGGTGNTRPQPTCSGTGRQTMADAICCLEVSVGLKTPLSAYLQMDLNNDGKVDSGDAVIIMDNLARGFNQ